MAIRTLLLLDPRGAPAASRRGSADVLVLDLAAAVPARVDRPTAGARTSRASPFHGADGPGLYARVSPLSSASLPAELDRAVDAGCDGIVLTGAVGTRDIEHLGARLSVLEAERGRADGEMRIVAVADTAAGVLALPALVPTPRLAGLACDPDRLAETLGCTGAAPAIRQALAVTVLAAAACRVEAILATRSRDATARAAAEGDGFGAVLVRDPAAVRPARGVASRTSSPASRRNNRGSRPA